MGYTILETKTSHFAKATLNIGLKQNVKFNVL